MPSIAKEVADKAPLDQKDMWNSSLPAPEPNAFVVLVKAVSLMAEDLLCAQIRETNLILISKSSENIYHKP